MSSRLARTLLKLYPRRVRNRYGEEMLALEDELNAHGEGSRTRLIRDMLAGALLVRPTRHRARLVIGAVCLIAAVAVAAGIIGGASIGVSDHGADPAPGAAARASVTQHPHRTPVRVLRAVPFQGVVCPVAAGSPCSSTPCSQFVGQPAIDDAAAHGSVAAAQRPRHLTTAHCAADPHIRPQRPLFVGG